MRCDQLMGLPPEAVVFLKEHRITPPICSSCERPFPIVPQRIGTFVGMFEDEYPLLRHELKDGRTADEFLQAAPWSSGPCFFLGLRVSGEDGKEFKWSESEIGAA